MKWCFDEAENAYGVVDIVSNNAGVAKPEKALSVDEESWDKVIDTNLKGVWLVSTEAARRMILKEVNGSIVNTSSIQGLRVAMDRASYAASKAAVIQLTKALALEWSEHKIRVNALCPGFRGIQLQVLKMLCAHIWRPGKAEILCAYRLVAYSRRC